MGQLWLGDEEIRLRPKTWDLLCLLVTNPGRLLSKDEIIDTVWGGALVSDNMPGISVAELRRALQDDTRQPRFIETVHRRGFRFIAAIESQDPDVAPTAVTARRLPAEERSPAPLFVGRSAELLQLEDLMTRSNPQRRIVLVSGDAGIGKTSLIHALLHRIERAEVVVGRGQCLAHFGESYPHLPILGALQDICRRHPDALDRLRAVAPSWLARMPALVSPAEHDELRGSAATMSQAQLIDEMVALLRALGSVVWVLDDLHWADGATLELVAVLAENIALTDFWVIGSLRLAEAIGRGHPIARMRRELLRNGRCREVMLEGLGESEIADYLTTRFPGVAYPQWLPERLLAHSNGNPFFLVHTVDHLGSDGALVAPAAGGLDEARLRKALGAIPETLRDLIQEEIAGLAEGDRLVLSAASVCGLETDAATIAAALGAEVEGIDASCSELARRTHFLERIGESLWPQGTISGRYALQHALYQKVLYEDQAPSTRREAHRRIGSALREAFGERAAEIAAVIADHFERGGDAEQAVTYHLLAAHDGSERYASQEAALHLRRALALLPPGGDDDRRETMILAELAKVLPALKGFGDPELQALYIQARGLRAKGAEARDELTLLISQLLADLMQRKPQPAEELARELLEMADAGADPVTRTYAEVLMGAVFYHQGDLAGTIDHSDRALAAISPTLAFGPMQTEGMVLVMCGAALWQAGQPDEGLTRALRGVTLARAAHPFNLVAAMQALAAIHQWRGEVAAARDAAHELSMLVQEQGILQAAAISLVIEAWASFESGEAEDARTKVEEGLAALRQHGSMMQSVYTLAVAVEVFVGLGQPQRTSEILEEAHRLIRDGDARWWEPELYRWHGVLADDDAAEAERWFERSFEIAAQQGAASLCLRTTLDLARLRQRQKRFDEARRVVAKALESISGGESTRDVRAAGQLLAELEPTRDPKPRKARGKKR